MSTYEYLTYCGGIPEAPKQKDLNVFAMPEHIEIQLSLFKKYKIPYDNIINISLKTSEQITKDVTLSGLLLIGIFAFADKKTTKHITNYLVIEYEENNVKTNVIFTGKAIPKFHASLLKVQQNYYKRYPEKIKKNIIETSDPYDEIEKLHSLLEKNIITQEEFDKKKIQLLGISE